MEGERNIDQRLAANAHKGALDRRAFLRRGFALAEPVKSFETLGRRI